MARPRKYIRPQFRRKCHYCGKMTKAPYIYHVIPKIPILDIVPYSRKSAKTPRSELKGSLKVQASHFCDQDCFNKSRPKSDG